MGTGKNGKICSSPNHGLSRICSKRVYLGPALGGSMPLAPTVNTIIVVDREARLAPSAALQQATIATVKVTGICRY
jgi:hypothetical protein